MSNLYFINQVHLSGITSWTKDAIGLFSGEYKCHGEGNFCGWYGAEYYDDMTLLAYYTRESENQGAKGYDPTGQLHTSNVIVKQHYDKILIGSDMWTIILEAETDDEAILKFFDEDYDRRNKDLVRYGL